MISGSEILHDPWPISPKKGAKSARKSRRQSLLAKEFEKLEQYHTEGANKALTSDNIMESTTEQGSAYKKRRRSSNSAGYGLLDPQPGTVENNNIMAKRRQSLLPVLRAASKGEEVEVIEGITSSASTGSRPATSVSQTIQNFRRSSIAAAENLMMKERLGSATQEEWLASVANMKRRRTSSFVKEGVASEISQQLSKSGKLEDQINLQHLVELMRVFNVRTLLNYMYLSKSD